MIALVMILQFGRIVEFFVAALTVRVVRALYVVLGACQFRFEVPVTGEADPVPRGVAYMLPQGIITAKRTTATIAINHIGKKK